MRISHEIFVETLSGLVRLLHATAVTNSALSEPSSLECTWLLLLGY